MPSGTPGYHLLLVAGESQCRLVTWTFTSRIRCWKVTMFRMQLRAAITPFCQRVHEPGMYKNLVGVLMFQISFSSLIVIIHFDKFTQILHPYFVSQPPKIQKSHAKSWHGTWMNVGERKVGHWCTIGDMISIRSWNPPKFLGDVILNKGLKWA